MPGILFDSSVYITALRSGDEAVLSARTTHHARKPIPVWLSVVVLEELYAGARNAKAQKLILKFEKDFERGNRILVPAQSDWTSAGKILNKIGEKYGFERVGKSRLTNDTLIAMTIARNGLTLLTANTKDFERIAEFRPFDWKLI